MIKERTEILINVGTSSAAYYTSPGRMKRFENRTLRAFMSQDEVTQIKVGGSATGVIGLKAVLKDMAER